MTECVLAGGAVVTAGAAALAVYDLWIAGLRWRTGLALVVVAWVPLLIAMGMVAAR